MTNLELAGRLRALAQLYEDNPEAAQPYEANSGMTVYLHDKDETAITMRAFGAGVKTEDGNHINFLPTRYPGMRLCIFKANVCERVKVGTREIPAHIIPARPATAEIVLSPAHTEDVYEWRCGSLLDGAEEAGA